VHSQFLTKDGLPFVVREAVPGDAEQLLAGTRGVFEERLDHLITEPDEFTITLDQERAWIQKYLDADNSILLVAEQAGEIIGWVDLRGNRRRRMRHTGLLGITVVEPWRNRGVGAALLQTLISWATSNPILEKLKLGVMEDNKPALALYRKMGFEEEGRQVREYRKADGTYFNDILMARFVR
jgi:ribosomal protein S18 acetylase RimI-like enzyme